MTDTVTRTTCGTCRANRGELPAPGGVIYDDGIWRLEHIIPPIPMAGWLVLKPLRHIEAFADLSAEEAAPFGPLVQRITTALRDVIQPVKIYLCQFAEAENFSHIHFHLIPRAENMPREQRGPSVFALLSAAARDGRDLAPVTEAERIAGEVRARLQRSPI